MITPGTVYGYCRISRATQSIDRQIRNIIEAYPKAKIYQEAYTGTTTDRPQWQRLQKIIKAGDTIVFDSVSRMSRNAAQGFAAYKDLNERGIILVFLKEPHLNTETFKAAADTSIQMTGTDVDIILTAVNKYIEHLAEQQIIIAFEQAEKEVQDLHQRTSEGMITAKLNGKRIGTQKGDKLTTKKSIQAKELIKKHSKSFGGTLSDDECIALCGISHNSFYKYKKEIKAAAEAEAEAEADEKTA